MSMNQIIHRHTFRVGVHYKSYESFLLRLQFSNKDSSLLFCLNCSKKFIYYENHYIHLKVVQLRSSRLLECPVKC
jgi:hypothetical protein